MSVAASPEDAQQLVGLVIKRYRPAFKHDEKNHTYHLDGLRLISTTDLLERFGLTDYSAVNPFLLEEAANIGTAVSEATALLDQGKSWKNYSALGGYVSAWQAFKKEFKFKPTLIEEPMYDEDFLFATRPDCAGESKYGYIVVQKKTCKISDAVAIQTAAEERAINRSIRKDTLAARTTSDKLLSSAQRFAVELKPDGTFKPRQFDDPGDLKVFLGMLTAGRWLRNHGKWKLPGE